MRNYKWDREFILDLFGTAQTLVPACVGGTLVLVGWATGAIALLLVGAGVVAGGMAMGLARLVTDGEKIYKSQLARERQAKIERDQAELDRVASLIQYDTDKRTREFLKELRSVKVAFDDQLLQQEVGSFISTDFRDRFTTLFWKAVRQIERANKLLRTSQGMKNKDGVLKARDRVIDEVGETVITLTNSFEGLTTIALTQDAEWLGRLRDDLESRLAVTESVTSEMQGFRTVDVDEEYLPH